MCVDPAPATTPVPNALVRTDLDLALDVLGHVAAKVAFDLQVGVDPGPELGDFLLSEVATRVLGLTPVEEPTKLDVVLPMPKCT